MLLIVEWCLINVMLRDHPCDKITPIKRAKILLQVVLLWWKNDDASILLRSVPTNLYIAYVIVTWFVKCLRGWFQKYQKNTTYSAPCTQIRKMTSVLRLTHFTATILKSQKMSWMPNRQKSCIIHSVSWTTLKLLLQTLWTFCHVSDDTIYHITTLSQTTNT